MRFVPIVALVVAFAVAVDAAGNRYVAGNYVEGADLDPGKGVQTRSVRAQGGDPYVTKLDASGKWVWTQTFGGTGNDQIQGLATDGTTVFACGTFESNDAGFGAVGSISAHYDANNFGAGFVIALDAASGAPRTTFNGTGAQTFGNTGGGRTRVYAVCVSGGGLYVGGEFNSFLFGVGGTGGANSTGQSDGFVAQLDAATGAARTTFSGDGVQTFGGNGNEIVRSLAESNGRLYVGGTMGSTNFGIGGVGTVSSGAQYDEDAFLAVLQTSDGAASSAFSTDGVVTFGATGSAEHGSRVATDGVTAYLAGDANGAGAKIDGAGAAFPNIGGSDAFVLAVDAASGGPRTAFAGGVRFFGSTGSGPTFIEGTTSGLVVTPGGVYVSGYLGGAGAGIGAAGSVEQADSFLLALDPATGNALVGFAGDGVQTFTGADVSGNHQPAITAGLAGGASGLWLLGSSFAAGRVGPEDSKIVFPSAGVFLVSVDPPTGDPVNMPGVNHRPVFNGPPVATPNPVVAGKATKFRVLVSDADKNPLKLTWDFADDSASTSKSPSKKYAAPGTYGVTVVADDGKAGGSATSGGAAVYVVPAGTPYFDVTKLTVSLKFPQAGKDVISVSGQFPLADGTSLAGKTLTIEVSDVQQSFVLASTGKGATSGGTATVKPPKGGVAKFTATLHGDFAAALADEGLTADVASNRYAPTTATVTFDGVANAETYPLFWTNKAGTAGAAR